MHDETALAAVHPHQPDSSANLQPALLGQSIAEQHSRNGAIDPQLVRRGVLNGTVNSVSRDAIADEKLGLYHAACVRVSQSSMHVDGVDVGLSPGMAVTAEVTTGTRRLIDFVISPVMAHLNESGRER